MHNHPSSEKTCQRFSFFLLKLAHKFKNYKRRLVDNIITPGLPSYLEDCDIYDPIPNKRSKVQSAHS